MRSFILIYSLILGLISPVWAFESALVSVGEEDVLLQQVEDISESSLLFDEPVLLESEAQHLRFIETEQKELPAPNLHKLYSSVSRTLRDIYELQIEDTNTVKGLLQDKLTWDLETGPIERVHLWGTVQTNMNLEFEENNDLDTKFRVNMINILVDGKFRGGKEEFMFFIDPTPQSVRPYFQPFVQDAYIQTRRIPNHLVLVGNSRPGVGIEGAQSPYTLPLWTRSQISRHFANARKVGVRVRGNYSLVDYDLGGYSSDTYFSEFMPGAEFNGWINFKPLGKTNGKYGKLVTGGGVVSGARHNVDFFVTGAYLGYEYKKLWMRAEYASADGSNGSTGLTSKEREGWYATLGYKLSKKLELIARYDEFDQDKNISSNNKREYTAGMNYYIKGQALKFVLNYIYIQTQNKADSHRLLFGTQLIL